MKNPNDGRIIRQAWFSGENGNRVIAKPGQVLKFKNEFHGDHDIDWVIAEENGREIYRHNARYLATIEWGDE